MGLIDNFNANDDSIEAMQDFSLIKQGDYLMAVTEQEEKLTKDHLGAYLKLTVSVLDGEQKGSRIWRNLNLKNKSEIAVKIAKSELKSICLAVGIDILKHPSQLIGKPFIGSVSIKPATFAKNMDGSVMLDPQTGEPVVEFQASNEIKKYAPVKSKAVVQQPVAATAAKPWSARPSVPVPEPEPLLDESPI